MPSVHGGAIVASVIPSPPLGTDATVVPHGLGADGAPPVRTDSVAGKGVGPQRGPGERRFRFELAAHPGSVARARRLTTARLSGWSVCEDTCETAALVVSELVTNAIVHTASEHVVCELHDGADLVRIAVRDEGCAAGEPHSSPARQEEEHGRGLLLIDALCQAWGAHEHGSGLIVWAELPRAAAGAPTAGEPTAGEPAAGDPRGDLGWGSRPKPGPADGPDDEDEARGRHDEDGAQGRHDEHEARGRHGEHDTRRRHDGTGTGAAWL
ncbi:ATP-binding protein [Streptomyces sp. KAU_LT]|uniref:ATP-binding protein n=1 Tax=Streptomyces sp. KAU_LT TaxID=3046669 RepID=UPI0024B75CDF|nr:ATP-binding protein [Streptomyces sp. KAU_LT]MDI9834154.1 ATP-binding protein [Streptomyces sp. KAU_LT]